MIGRHLVIRLCRAALGLAIACGGSARPASAQMYVSHDVPRAGSLELSGGVVWSAGSDLGSVSRTRRATPEPEPTVRPLQY